MRKVANFNQFKEDPDLINEGWIGDFSKKVKSGVKSAGQKIKSVVSGWIDQLKKDIQSGKNVPINKKTGKPAVKLYLPEDGPIDKQMASDKMGLQEDVNESSDKTRRAGTRVPLTWTGAGGDVRDVRVGEVTQDIIDSYLVKKEEGWSKAIFIFGAPGIGKTQTVGQAATKLNVPLLVWDVQFFMPEDFLGIPSKVDVQEPVIKDGKLVSIGKGVTRQNPPAWLPQDNGEDDRGGIIFMDELNRANEAVQNALLKFVQSGEIGSEGTYKLPDKWIIVAAGNRPEDVPGRVTEPDTSFSDRFEIKNLVPQVEDWTEWAKQTGYILPELAYFFSNEENQEDHFHYLTTDVQSLNFPSPRGWSEAARKLNSLVKINGLKDWREMDLNKIKNIFHDSVGPVSSQAFVDFLKVLKEFTREDMEDMIKNPAKAKMMARKEIPFLYSLGESAFKIKPNLTNQELYNLIEYFSRYNNLEFLAWFYKYVLDRVPSFRASNKKSEDPEEILKQKAAAIVANKSREEGIA